MNTLPNYKLTEFEYNPTALFDILYKEKDLLDKKTRVFRANELQIKEIATLLDIKNLQSVVFFIIPPNNYSSIHVDSHSPATVPWNSMATNLPLVNCNNVKMSWYKSIKNRFITNYDVEPPVPTLSIDQAELIDSIYYTQPIQVQILEWHQVSNESSDFAYFCSLRFFKD
jgi:DNA-binding transcriptional MerR regulator